MAGFLGYARRLDYVLAALRTPADPQRLAEIEGLQMAEERARSDALNEALGECFPD